MSQILHIAIEERLTHFTLEMDKPSKELNDRVSLDVRGLSLGSPITPTYILVLPTLLMQSDFIKQREK